MQLSLPEWVFLYTFIYNFNVLFFILFCIERKLPWIYVFCYDKLNLTFFNVFFKQTNAENKSFKSFVSHVFKIQYTIDWGSKIQLFNTFYLTPLIHSK